MLNTQVRVKRHRCGSSSMKIRKEEQWLSSKLVGRELDRKAMLVVERRLWIALKFTNRSNLNAQTKESRAGMHTSPEIQSYGK